MRPVVKVFRCDGRRWAAVTRLAMIGMNVGNGHPYSWSAIVNGYDRTQMQASPYPRIADYLSREHTPALSGARVTHVWSARRAEAEHVAKTCGIPHVLDGPADAVGRVDAVVIPTDEADQHRGLAEPYLRAGLPVLVDKPLALSESDLEWFAGFAAVPGRLMSCSAVRFSPRLGALRRRLTDIGRPSLVIGVTWRRWAAYGAHLVEGVISLFPAAHPVGLRAIRSPSGTTVVIDFDPGPHAVLMVHEDAPPTIHLEVCGTEGITAESVTDSFAMFRGMLRAFVTMATTGTGGVPFSETLRVARIVAAAESSAAGGGRPLELSERAHR
jgi:GFO/IDH/MocA oxidoreductase family protein